MENGTSKAQRIIDGIGAWASFYRANIHRFCIEYLNIKLKMFQQIIILLMNECMNGIMVAARGIGKTFLTAVFCCARCILYPGTICVVASKTRKQAAEIAKKIQEVLMPNSPMLCLEIDSIIANQYDTTVSFKNGSSITIVCANDNARGKRCNVLIVDESRLVPSNIVSTILRKFLTAVRHPPFMDLPEYADYKPEENKELHLTSAWYQASPCYELFKRYSANMLLGKSFFAVALPYQLSIKERLLTRERVENEFLDPLYSDITWMMEMEAEFWSGTDGALYSFDEVAPARRIQYAFYPPKLSALIPDKRINIPPKLHNEQRILSADLALMASNSRSNNDATSIFINQLIATTSGRFEKNIVYTENNEGLRAEVQALNIRRLFAQFSCDYLVIDGRGLGLPILDALMADMYDPELGVVYGALSCCNNDDIAARCKVKGAPKVIWAINATPEFNSQCALTLREEFRQGNIRLLNDEDDFDEDFAQLSGFAKLSLEDKIKLKAPYMHTSLLVNELINLQYETKNGLVRVKERSNMRKDRYSSLSYNIYVSGILEREITNNTKPKSLEQMVFEFKTPVVKTKR